jgi:hypothetical protein
MGTVIFSIIRLSIVTFHNLNTTLSINGTQHNNIPYWLLFMLSDAFYFYYYAERGYAGCLNAECHGA